MNFRNIGYTSPKNFFEKTTKQITSLAFNYNENEYRKIIKHISKFILNVSDIVNNRDASNSQANVNSTLASLKFLNMSNKSDLSEYNANTISDKVIEMYKQEVFNIVLLLSNYNEVFYNTQTHSVKYTLDLLLCIIQPETIFNCTSLESRDVILSIIHKIYISLKQLNENKFNDKYIKKCIEALKTVDVPDNSIVQALQLRFHELINSNNSNNSPQNVSSLSDNEKNDCLPFAIEKPNIKNAFEAVDFKAIEELYRNLEKESIYIEQIENTKLSSKQELLTNNLYKYMYFMKQLLSHIDKHTTNNALFQQLFFNLL